MSDNSDATNKNQKLLWTIVILLLIILIGGGGYGGWMFYDMKQGGGGPFVSAANPPAAPPIYMQLESFTVNLTNPDNNLDRVLYTVITLRVPNEATQKQLTSHLPEVRSKLVALLSRQNINTLSTPEGKQQLAAQIKTTLSQPYVEGQSSPIISDVLFTTFILR